MTPGGIGTPRGPTMPETFPYPLAVVQIQMAAERLMEMQEEMQRLLSDLDCAVYLAEPIEINVDDEKHEAWEAGLIDEAQRRRRAVLEADDG
jgi:hypothetical protein